MATPDRPKKKKGFLLNFYKSSTKSSNNYMPGSKPIVTNNELVSHAMLSGKPKTCREIVQGGRRSVDGGGGRGGGGGNLAVVEARKSVSQIEMNSASVAAFLQVKVLVSDMPGFMQVHAFRCARTTYDSLEKFSSKHIAYNLKKEFDKLYGPAWHCIVGSSFGSYVTHSTGCFLYFSMEKLCILVFKTKVQKAASE